MHQHVFGQIIRERREIVRITQEQLADMAGVGLRTLKAIEVGQGNPTVETLNKLATILGLELTLTLKHPQR